MTENRSYIKYRLWLILWICIPVIVYCIPLDNILNGESICLIRHCTGKECWGCGTTRAFFCFMHFRFQEAWEYNRTIVIVAPILIYLYIRVFIGLMKKK